MLVDPRTEPRQRVVDRVLGFWPEIVVAARRHQVPEAVLAGLVCQESAGRPDAKRHEPHYRWLFGARPGDVIHLPEGLSLAEDQAWQKWSWGLCQIMGAVAREYGYAGRLQDLLSDVATNLDLGAKHLARQLKRAKGDVRGALQAYNTGGIEIKGTDPYCDKALAWAALFPQIATPVVEAAPKGDAAPAPFAKEEKKMNWLLMGPLLNLAIKMAAKMIPAMLDKMHPGLTQTLSTEVSGGMKDLIQKGLGIAQTFAESTPTNLDNYLVQAAQSVADSLGLLPGSVPAQQTDTP